jgi:hypothetical protein
MTADNPYQSPTVEAGPDSYGEARSDYGPFAMLLWGLVAGIMLGATFGAVGGGVIGLACFAALAIDPRGQFALGPAETWLVLLVAGGTIAGALGGILNGSLLGPVLALLGWGTGWRNATRFVVAASVLSALGAVATAFVVGRTLAEWPSSEGLVVRVFAVTIAGAAGAIGGRRLGWLLLQITRPERLGGTKRADGSSIPVIRRH